jgi:hypothetical protein
MGGQGGQLPTQVLADQYINHRGQIVPHTHYCLPTQILVDYYAPASFFLQTSSSHKFHLIDILRQVRDIPYDKNELQWT